MSNRIKNNLKNLVGQTLNQYYSKVKPTISDLRYKQEYQNRIIECMVGEVDDNYITTHETDNPIVKLEHSKEGLVKVPTVKGKTILVDADGNETDTPAEGCRLVSVGEEEDNKLIILSKNKNLFDGEIEYGYLGDANGEIQQPQNKSAISSKNFIKINNTEFYYISLNCDANVVLSVYFYDEGKNYLGYSGLGGVSECKIIPRKNSSYMKFRLFNGNKDGIKLSDLKFCQIEQSETKTSYIEPKYHKTEILLDKPLRKINSNIYDEIIGNKIIRRIGKIVLNGSETYREYEDVNNRLKNVVGYFVHMGDMKLHSVTLCNLLPSYPYNEADDIGCKVGGSPDIHLYFPKSLITSKEVFTQYISENNVEVLYELAEPIVEELPNGITLQGFDDTTMYIENSITPTVSYGYNALIPYKEELSQQKEEVEINTLDIENNIIPYLMDMEFNLMTMEDK